MSSAQAITTVLVALFTGALGSVAKGYFDRPRTKSESDAVQMSASVSMSTEVRQWAQIFVDRAQKAEERADVAERKANDAEERLDHLEATMVKVYMYVRSLQTEITNLGGHPSTPPPELEQLWK